MHPLLARPASFLLYLLAWAALGALSAGALGWTGARAFGPALALAVPLAVFYGLVCLSAWWVCRANPVTRASPPRIVLIQLAAAAQAGFVWALAGAAWVLILNQLSRGAFPLGGSARFLPALWAAGLPLYLLSAGVHYLFAVVAASHEAERQALESQVHAREAELRALRAQLNPHFLFNSLNSVNALVGSDPEGARRMCERLGDFLRLTLRLGARESVTLAEELELIDRYLAIEQVRFGGRLHVERVIAPEALGCRLPPLLLQPLVENAVKHGVAGRPEGGTVRLEAARPDGRLRITLTNPADDDAPARPGTGTGLSIVRRRLEVLGGRDAGISAVRAGGLFRVTLQLAAREDAPGEAPHA